ncbi:phage terminase small subunit [Heyndrickxia sporothermodurans]|uniref:phage terminase small subunit n=1 Tax=Heyndrickxia sporothermodurans TaxID=46224 RepID=UPI002DBF1532|nr:phage terminase small subunit [Heyndrickxia sporothermodurans]MEB6549091.1 phage terminase small subunit [Heyndrickxia sporothermodurans]
MNWDQIRREYETSKITLKALAEKHDIKIGTLKSRKSREGWSRDPTKKDATKKKKDATQLKGMQPNQKQVGQARRSGNPNPKNQFTERNSAAVKHGFFSKFLPADTLEIMEQMQERSPADLIYDQIQIQYAAILRAQNIMHVENKQEMIKELKKSKFEVVEIGDGEFKQIPVEEEYEFQFAWDRHATFLNAQSRAMSELRSLIKQFNDLAHEDDERRLKLEQMQLNVDKTKAEVTKIREETNIPSVTIVEDLDD